MTSSATPYHNGSFIVFPWKTLQRNLQKERKKNADKKNIIRKKTIARKNVKVKRCLCNNQTIKLRSYGVTSCYLLLRAFSSCPAHYSPAKSNNTMTMTITIIAEHRLTLASTLCLDIGRISFFWTNTR